MGATVLSNPRAVNESLMPLLCNAENAASVHPTTTQYSVTRDSAHLGVCCGSNSTLLMSLLQVWHTTPSFGNVKATDVPAGVSIFPLTWTVHTEGATATKTACWGCLLSHCKL